MLSSRYAPLLQRFSLSRDLPNTLCIHHCMLESGNAHHNTPLCNMLLDIYWKCGRLRDVCATFSCMHCPDVVSYSFIIKACGENKKGGAPEAFRLFDRLLIEGIIPNKFVFIAVLSSCARPESLLRGKHIHAYIISSGTYSDVVLRTALVHMYDKCMNLDMVKVVFEAMPERRDAILWNATILAHVNHGDAANALYLFGEMQSEDDEIVANRATFLTMLSLCRTSGLLDEGKWVHYYITSGGFDGDTVIGTSLISMYGKFFSLNDACNVFERLPDSDVAIWNSIISVHAQNEMGEEALSFFYQMHGKGVLPDMITFVAILSSCASCETLCQGKQLHVAANYEIDRNIILRNSVLNLYCKCGAFGDMERTFNDMYTRDVFTWNAMLSGCVRCEKPHIVLPLYYQMMEEGAIPDGITFVALLSCHLSLAVAKQIHVRLRSSKYESDVVAGTALVNIYGKCGNPVDAEMGFDDINYPNVFSWNAMISVYAQQGNYNKALNVFNKMTWEGISADKVTFHSIFSLCTKPEYLVSGKWLHTLAITRGIDSDVLLGNALINMYGKCGEVSSAFVAFERMTKHDHFSWNALIVAYAQCGSGEDALKAFHQMVWEGVMPDKVTFSSILSVCSSPQSLGKGRELHVHIRGSCADLDQVVGNALVSMYGKCDSIDDSLKSFYYMRDQNDVSFIAILSICANQVALEEGMKLHATMVESELQPMGMTTNALLNMYGKCGSIDDAEIMFDRMLKYDLVSWNIMISAYSQNGEVQNVFLVLKKMEAVRVSPDRATFVSILSACSHGGYVDEGWFFLKYMQHVYDVTPSSDHYNCMVDLLGRVGLKDEAEALVNQMPVDPTVVSWMALLGACRNQDDIEGGERAAERLLKLDAERSAPYVVLSNMYANSLKVDPIQLVNPF